MRFKHKLELVILTALHKLQQLARATVMHARVLGRGEGTLEEGEAAWGVQFINICKLVLYFYAFPPKNVLGKHLKDKIKKCWIF